ncbi:MAG: hypothetical protein AB7P99_06370 [Vicinamibacterales bacterium]
MSGQDLVERPSGLVVPAAVADAVQSDGVTRDADGRRRVVFTKDEVKRIRRVVELLNARGFQMHLRCDHKPEQPVAGHQPCGILLEVEGFGHPDHGFGCGCTRIHLGR